MTTITSADPRAQAATILRALGWRIRNGPEFTQVIGEFQTGWNLGPPLTVTGIVDPATQLALRVSERARAGGRPTASAHFSFSEFACRCGGRYSDCRRIWVRRPLLESLEVLRDRAYPAGLPIRSGCRCPRYNASVGGRPRSQHMYGAAADVPYAASSRQVAAWRLFAGIGRSASTGLVRHVDRRDVSGNNWTGGTLERPTRWVYAS